MFKIAFLMLGDRCNFRCKYCLQQDNLVDLKCETAISPRVYEYLIKQTKKLPEDEKFHIQFWGGEPLIYWDLIKKAVSILAPTDRFTFGIVSNGSLLTQEIVDYLNDHCFSFALSHDGENTELTRGRDVLKEPKILALFKQLNNAGIISVVSAKNQNLQKTREYFRSNYGIESIGFDCLLETWDMPKEIYDLDAVEYCKSIDELLDAFRASVESNTPSWESNFCMPVVNRLRLALSDPGNEVFNYPPCRNMYEAVNLGIDGTIYLCHNSSIVLGTIDSTHEELMQKYAEYNTKVKSERCRNCPFFYICGGGCLLVTEGERFERYCLLHQLYLSRLYEKLLSIGR